MSAYTVIGLRVDQRHANALRLQEALTDFGRHIKLRVGLHETNDARTADDGVILLQAVGSPEEIDGMMRALSALEGVSARKMEL